MYRFDIINSFIQKYNFKNYLEIGVCNGDNIRNVQCENKDGVDPGIEGYIVPETNYITTSDEFFAHNQKIYDIIFIDGLHHSNQVDKDIKNALKYTINSGIIILHDCNPPTPSHAAVPQIQSVWNGDVYKSVLKFQQNNYNHTYFTIDTDWGCGVIIKNIPQSYVLSREEYQNGIDNWEYFDKNRQNLLNLISIKTFEENYL